MDLKHKLIARFGITPNEAERLIDEAKAKVEIRQAVAAASRGEKVRRTRADFESPGEWRTEVQRRTMAVKVLREGVAALRKLQRVISMIAEREDKLIQQKTAAINDQKIDWWGFRESGWAMGGREAFVQLCADVFSNLDHAKVGEHIMTKLGFQRTVPLPEIVEPEPEPHERVERDILGL